MDKIMKFFTFRSGNSRGMVTVITLLVLVGVGILTFNAVIHSQMSTTASENYKHKIQTFYGADGLMTYLAQEMIDTAEERYLVNMMTSQNIGFTTPAGVYSYNKYQGIDTIKGAGTAMGGSSDQFCFVYRKIPARCDIFVRVPSLSNTSTNAVCGLMLRETLNPDAKQAFVHRYYATTSNIQLKTRRTAGASAISRTNATPGFGEWIRIKRKENIINAYRSDNGAVWIDVGSDTITMGDSIYAGLAVCSANSSLACNAVFKDLSGIIRRSCTDSVALSFSDNTRIRYQIDEIIPGVFSMETMGYKKVLTARNYVTTLNQSLSRRRTDNFVSLTGDSMMMPVTLYDYRSDMSNPEFMVNPSASNIKELTGMVQATLDADRKPLPNSYNSAGRSCILSLFRNNWYTVNAAARCSLFYDFVTWIPRVPFGGWPKCDTCLINFFNYPAHTNTWWFSDSLKKWFRPDRAPGALYDPLTARWTNLQLRKKTNWTTIPNEWVGSSYDSTKPFANIVVYDSLKFREIPPGSGVFVFGDSTYTVTVDTQLYVFGCSGASEKKPYKFMPLKKRGFKADAPVWYRYIPVSSCSLSTENFCFSMEMHRKFTYKAGQKFTFKGDDDVWVFINNKLVIDLGGIHTEVAKSVLLDTIPGLVDGEEYWFDLFYCERLFSESNIYITTNMLMFVPPLANKRSWRRDYGSLD